MDKKLEERIVNEGRVEGRQYVYVLYDHIAFSEIRRAPLDKKDTDPKEWETVKVIQ